jgi:4-hydroxy-2-oxoglutarate aldolase
MKAVTRRFGVSGLKAALDMFGYYGGPTRRPLAELDSATKKIIRQIFIDSGFPPEQ